jgi:hypothetical protein
MVDRLNQAHTLISFYQTQYQKRFNRRPVLNRNKLKYLIADILRDLSVAEVQKLIAYYIKIEKDPELISLCYEYAEILEQMRKNDTDSEERANLRRDTERRVMEYRERYGK